MVVVRPGQVPGGVPGFLAQTSTPIPPGTFLPPVTGAVGGPADTQTVLLMHADGTNGSTSFIDSSAYAHTLTASNGAQISTANPKFGSGAIDTSTNTAAVIDTGNISDFAFGNQPFTVEAWSYFQSDTNALHLIACQWSPAGATNYSWLFGMTDSATLGLYYTTNTADFTLISGAFTPTLNTWYHLACDRDASDVVRVYVNGAVIGSGSVAGKLFLAPTTNCAIGNELSGTYDVQGFLDEVRISKGIARYGGAFTPPTAPFSIGGPLAEDAQTLSAAGTVGAAGAITGTLNVTQQAQTIAAAGGVTVTGALNVTQQAQAIAASGAPRVGGTLGVPQAPQTIAAAGGPRVGGTLGVAQQAHTLLATGTVGAGAAITGSLVVPQAPQSLVAMATVAAVASSQARAFVLA